MKRAHRLIATTIALAVTMTPARAQHAPSGEAPPILVYILAGQSNMEGKAQVALLERQLDRAEPVEELGHLRPDGEWLVRDDVWIKFLDRKGNLTVGFGSPDRIGPELEFGITVGDRHSEQVLLIKTAWGGKSLFWDFRPPSSGEPPAAELQRRLADARKRDPDTTLAQVEATYGTSYREMLSEIQSTLADLATHFPDAHGRACELAGFVWFQGWNDMIDSDYTAAYTENMANFIRDVRKDLEAPELPFVIGVLGVDGKREAPPGDKKETFKQAQAAVGQLAEFKGNVAIVQTDRTWDQEADAVFRKGWEENLEEWNQVGSDRPYHYLGSVRTMVRIGHAFGDAVLRLRQRQARQRHER